MNLTRIENKLLILSQRIGVATYDFDFDHHFHCTHPHKIDTTEPCVLRIGPIPDYAAEYGKRQKMGLQPVNSPSEHARASELEQWYLLIREFTPRSRVFEDLPTADEIEADFSWPVFLKGSRQTSRHNPKLSVIEGRSHYGKAAQEFRKDAILQWQKPVIREFVDLAPVFGEVPGKIRPSEEYRSFWWNGSCVGWGRYWHQVPHYESPDIEAGLKVASQAACRLRVPFLVVDIAKTTAGRWIVIECNDAQESGYLGVQPQALWLQILMTIEETR